MENKIRWVTIEDDCSYHGYFGDEHIFHIQKFISLWDVPSQYRIRVDPNFRRIFSDFISSGNPMIPANNNAKTLEDAKLHAEKILDKYAKMQTGHNIYGE